MEKKNYPYQEQNKVYINTDPAYLKRTTKEYYTQLNTQQFKNFDEVNQVFENTNYQIHLI